MDDTYTHVGKIHLLQSSVIDQIAAGEIIERPAYALKELLENALDAGADKIIVKLIDGGKKLIEVSDNGFGMTNEEMYMAIKRHTTSKLNDISDLTSISSYGFRGEALPSIASVSVLTVISRIASEDAGYLIRLEGGKITEGHSETRAPGTSVMVEELFYSTPARQKFLKGERTEFGYSIKEVEKLAIAYPHIRLQLFHNDKQVLDLHSETSLLSRLIALWGDDFKDKMFQIKHDTNGKPSYGFSGYLGHPDYTLRDSRRFYVYLNKRPIESRLILAAVKQGLGLEPNQYPIGALFLHLDLSDVDINIHPRKIQVEFYRRDMIFREIVRGIRKEMGRSLQPFVQVNMPSGEPDLLFRRGIVTNSSKQLNEESNLFERINESIINNGNNEERREEKERREFLLSNLWQLHDSYILTATHGGLLIVDQHNAHERIIFESLKKQLDNKQIVSERMIFPLMVDAEPELMDRFEQVRSVLEELGFECKGFGDRMIVVDAVPQIEGEAFSVSTFKELLEEIDPRIKAEELKSKVMATVACKAAIKAGRKLELAEMNSLIDKLFACDDPHYCPHGRPILIKFPMLEIEKLLGRR